MKILILDIEISPTIATVWGLFNQNLGIHQITGNSEVLTWAAKWEGSDEITYSSLGMTSKRRMLKEIYSLLEEADTVVTYNGDRFDLKILNQEFMLQGWAPPAPYKSVDLLKTMKNRFRGTSNKLDYWLKRLELGEKIKTRGHDLWLDCMKGDKEAYEEMSEYNVHDVIETEKLFERVRPWITGFPNMSVFNGDYVCPSCGSKHLQKRGKHRTNTLTYQRYRCNKCGHWSRDTKAIPAKHDKVVSIK